MLAAEISHGLQPVNLTEKVNRQRTDRLLLRPLDAADSDAFFDIFSDAETLKYWSGEPVTRLEDAEALLQQDLKWAASENCLCLGVAMPESNRLIGKVTLFQFSEQNRRAEVGYILDRRHWGKGYMTEVMTWLLSYAFDSLNLHRIEADTDPENAASLALLEKFGFCREGLFRDRWWIYGQWCDSVMLGLLEEDYRQNLATRL
jgi:RimJ/RimL family protein N-acetyltransferase